MPLDTIPKMKSFSGIPNCLLNKAASPVTLRGGICASKDVAVFKANQWNDETTHDTAVYHVVERTKTEWRMTKTDE